MAEPDQYCLKCGTLLEPKLEEGILRDICPRCGWVHYRQLKVGAGGLIVEDRRILLVQRANEPWRGCWYLPAGYAEVDETPAQTAEREIWEETGLRVKARELVDVYFYNDDPRGNGLLVLYACEVVSGELRGSNETLDARFFSAEDIPVHLAGMAHFAAVDAWRRSRLE